MGIGISGGMGRRSKILTDEEVAKRKAAEEERKAKEPKKRGRKPSGITPELEDQAKREALSDAAIDSHGAIIGTQAARKGGAKSSYSYKKVEIICSMLAGGARLRDIFKLDGMPSRQTFYTWLMEHKELQELYALARDCYFAEMADEILEIADERHVYAKCDENGEVMELKVDSALVMHQALRVKARQWVLERVRPSIYGTRGNGVEITIKQDESGGSGIDALIKIGESSMHESSKLYEQINERRARMGLPLLDENGNEIIDAEIVE